MLGWAIGFFIAAAIAAAVAYGVVETRFTAAAMDVFWALIALFGASLLFAVFGGKYAAPFSTSGRAFARVAFVLAVALSAYVWVDSNWSTQLARGDGAQLAANAEAPPVTASAAPAADDAALTGETELQEEAAAQDGAATVE